MRIDWEPFVTRFTSGSVSLPVLHPIMEKGARVQETLIRGALCTVKMESKQPHLSQCYPTLVWMILSQDVRIPAHPHQRYWTQDGDLGLLHPCLVRIILNGCLLRSFFCDANFMFEHARDLQQCSFEIASLSCYFFAPVILVIYHWAPLRL